MSLLTKIKKSLRNSMVFRAKKKINVPKKYINDLR